MSAYQSAPELPRSIKAQFNVLSWTVEKTFANIKNPFYLYMTDFGQKNTSPKRGAGVL